MPLFGNKFNPKKGTPRKSPSLSNLNLDASEKQAEFGLQLGPVRLRLGSSEMLFSDGEWITEGGTGGGSSNQKDVMRTRRENQQLKEENNLLKIKLELLLDMLSERTAEVHLQENEIEQLKKLSKRR